jgi:hypothetical protein
MSAGSEFQPFDSRCECEADREARQWVEAQIVRERSRLARAFEAEPFEATLKRVRHAWNAERLVPARRVAEAAEKAAREAHADRQARAAQANEERLAAQQAAHAAAVKGRLRATESP